MSCVLYLREQHMHQQEAINITLPSPHAHLSLEITEIQQKCQKKLKNLTLPRTHVSCIVFNEGNRAFKDATVKNLS